MTLRTFSSILPFTRRFGVRGVTCMTSGALGGGGGEPGAEDKKNIKETALAVLRELPAGEFIRATDWVNKTAKYGFNAGAVWRGGVGEIKKNPDRYGVEWVPEQGYRMAETEKKPAASARLTEKARWSIHEALKGSPEGMPIGELIGSTQRDWPGEFDGDVGRGRIRAARFGMRLKQLGNGAWQLPDQSDPAAGGSDEPPASQPDDEELLKSSDGGEEEKEEKQREQEREWERMWYPPIAKMLVDEGICTSAKPSGDALNGEQWTNPDIVGKIVPPAAAKLHGFSTCLVAVEVKRRVDKRSLLTGFAEACAYLEFAHISWLVVPWCDKNHIYRIERLCGMHGLGLAYVIEEDDDGKKALRLEVGVKPCCHCHKPGAREFAEFLVRLEKAEIDLFNC